ncbi:hypothetical protein ACFWM3_23390 [Gottfriedia sp. NPDC058432]|uniref:hypothetical protein n=1 Tax=Gottfriedia sp. NPDC058432 TaxID=3346497 RepID=UPI00365B2763
MKTSFTLNKIVLKGILSFLIGVILFGFLFLWKKDMGLIANFLFSITAGILGYMVVSPLLKSIEEKRTFESKFDKWLGRN